MIGLKPILKQKNIEAVNEILNKNPYTTEDQRLDSMVQTIQAFMQESFDMGVAVGMTAHKFKERFGYWIGDDLGLD